MSEREFTYIDGINEGRLNENGFFAIGNSMFVHRNKNIILIVTVPQDGDCKFEMLETNSEQPEKEMEYTAYVEWARNDDYTFHRIEVHGEFNDILEVSKLAKSNFK